MERPDHPVASRSPSARALYARAAVALRALLPLIVIAGAWAAQSFLPRLGDVEGSGPEALLPDSSRALATQRESVERFGFPLVTRTLVVQRDPGGLTQEAVEATYRLATDASAGGLPGLAGLAAAVPFLNDPAVPGDVRERRTTIVTYLYIDPMPGGPTRPEIAERYARLLDARAGSVVGVTGAQDARNEAARRINDRLPLIEAGTLLVVLAIVALAFRSLVAPLLALAVIGLTFLTALPVVAWISIRLGFAVPSELEPLVVALLVGIAADYMIFFLAAMRRRLAAGEPRLAAARATTRDFAPIVLVAALTVGAGTAALTVADLEFVRSLGPGLAVTVLVAGAVSMLFVPPVLALLGRRLFWPSRPGDDPSGAPPDPAGDERRALSERVTRVMTARPAALLIAGVCLAGLVAGAWGLREGRLASGVIAELPDGSEAAAAARAAERGLTPGAVAPTVLLVTAPGLAGRDARLAGLGEALAREPGVDVVLGPGRIPVDLAAGPFVTQAGDAARYVLMLGDDPYGSRAIRTVEALESRLPGLLRDTDLADADAALTGDTALARETVALMNEDLVRVAVAVVLVNLAILVIFLRALVAPLFLVAVSALSVATSLGLTCWLFVIAGQEDLIYYVPFAATVLLMSLGSDYNILLVGRVWDEARVRSLRDAIAVTAPRAGRTITIAGLCLASSFALLALVPLLSFRELALTVVAGVLIDTFVVRSLLVPALIALFGTASGWPGGRLRRAPEQEREPRYVIDR